MVSEAAIQELKKQLRGELLRAGDGGYDAARRVWNGMIDRRPALIARCVGAADVAQCVNFVREHDLPVSVRGGGHNIAGNAVCDDGLMIDLSRMKSVRVDPVRRTARADPGLTWGEFDRETQAFGLATIGGHQRPCSPGGSGPGSALTIAGYPARSQRRSFSLTIINCAAGKRGENLSLERARASAERAGSPPGCGPTSTRPAAPSPVWSANVRAIRKPFGVVWVRQARVASSHLRM